MTDATRGPSNLVIWAHPLEDSYSAALLAAIIDRLASEGLEASVARLWQDGPVAAARLAGVEHLVVVYPTWWGSQPSLLLGWIQKVLGPTLDGGEPSPLARVRRLSVVTTHGSSRFLNRLQGEAGLQLWRRSILPVCAPEADFDWVALYKLDRLDEDELTGFIADAAARVVAAVRATSVSAPS